MIYSRLFAVAASMTSLAAAQASTGTNFTTCCNVNPASVDGPTRASWCRAQMNTCPLLCPNGQVTDNICDNNALTYTCTCASGNTPNVSDYAQTLPSLMCDEWRGQCTANSPNDLAGQTFCQSFICGSRNASAELSSSGGSSGSASSSAASSGASATESSASSTGSTAASSSSAAAVALQVGKEYGTAGMAVVLLGIFGLAL